MIKKVLLMTLLIPFFGYSQIGKSEKLEEWIKVGKLTNPNKYVELSSQGYGETKLYRLSFQNMEYEIIDDICNIFFKSTISELNYLRDELVKGCKFKKGERVSLDVGEGKIVISHSPSNSQVRMTYYEDGSPSKYTWFMKGQIYKVFGVKK
jgi:hypothetical protein